MPVKTSEDGVVLGHQAPLIDEYSEIYECWATVSGYHAVCEVSSSESQFDGVVHTRWEQLSRLRWWVGYLGSLDSLFVLMYSTLSWYGRSFGWCSSSSWRIYPETSCVRFMYMICRDAYPLICRHWCSTSRDVITSCQKTVGSMWRVTASLSWKASQCCSGRCRNSVHIACWREKRRRFTGWNWAVTKYLFNMKLTKCGFEADPLRSIEKRIHQQFARRIENVELQSMLNGLSVSWWWLGI